VAFAGRWQETPRNGGAIIDCLNAGRKLASIALGAADKVPRFHPDR
jgi:hypothetical protein